MARMHARSSNACTPDSRSKEPCIRTPPRLRLNYQQRRSTTQGASSLVRVGCRRFQRKSAQSALHLQHLLSVCCPWTALHSISCVSSTMQYHCGRLVHPVTRPTQLTTYRWWSDKHNLYEARRTLTKRAMTNHENQPTFCKDRPQ